MNATVPIADPERRWQWWRADEIYDPDNPDGSGRYVPNPDDLVYSKEAGIYRVESVDYSTGESVWTPMRFPTATGIDADEGVLQTTAPGPARESYRAFIDTSVVPYTLAINARLRFYGHDVKSVRVYIGTDVENGEILSRDYDANGNVVSDKIPVTGVTDPSGGESEAISIVEVGHASRQVPDGELLTVVAYDDLGHVVSTAVLLAVNTSWIRRAEENVKKVESIALESSFLSPSNDQVLAIPNNLNIESVPLYGVVRYTNGERKKLPVDGTKFRLFGINRFVSGVLGQKQPMTLMYYLGSDEESYEAQDNNGGHIAKSYTATTIEADGAYAFKIFSHPEWRSNSEGYRLKHYLYNLERDTYHDVTSKVTLASTSPEFMSSVYGQQQVLTFALDVSKVNAQWKQYTHLQTTYVTLDSPGYESQPPHWRVRYNPGDEPFGGVIASVDRRSTSDWRVTIDNGFLTRASWLEEVFYKLQPIHQPGSESRAPEPTHFVIEMGNWKQEYSMQMWNAQLQANDGVVNGQLLYLHFLRRTADKDLMLGTAGLVVVRTD